MTSGQLSLFLKDETATARCACQLGARLAPGDTLLLSGDVGAGKSFFARALIRDILITPEDIPSPTFTLVQTYETSRGPLWHADLYRLTSVAEVEELGLIDAIEDAICVIEWPDRLADLASEDALAVTLIADRTTDARQLEATWQHPKWQERLIPWLT